MYHSPIILIDPTAGQMENQVLQAFPAMISALFRTPQSLYPYEFSDYQQSRELTLLKHKCIGFSIQITSFMYFLFNNCHALKCNPFTQAYFKADVTSIQNSFLIPQSYTMQETPFSSTTWHFAIP